MKALRIDTTILYVRRWVTSRAASLLIVLLFLMSCSDFVTIPGSETEINRVDVFEDNVTAMAAMASIYSSLSQQTSFSAGSSESSVTYLQALVADELNSSSSSNSLSAAAQFYFNDVTSNNDAVSGIWRNCYGAIYSCNVLLEGVEQSRGVTLSVKSQLRGEALFIRAFCHFYLVNLFGDVPLIQTSDYRANAKVSRAPTDQVYAGVIDDLLEAKSLLSSDYPSAGRARPNKFVATALLARAYLYVGDDVNAEVQASEVIDNRSKYKLQTLDSVFLNGSQEAIWQILPGGGTDKYTYEGFAFIQVAPPVSTSLRNDLLASFEKGDLRRTHWVDSLTSTSGLTKWFFPYKYKQTYNNATSAESSMVLRLAEQYLIRAEARANLDKLTGENSAETDVNAIRSRAGLDNTSSSSKTAVLDAIARERRVELFTEWGHRFFDLKRTGQLDAVLDLVKPNWDSNDSLLPLPLTEILINKNLIQNQGY